MCLSASKIHDSTQISLLINNIRLWKREATWLIQKDPSRPAAPWDEWRQAPRDNTTSCARPVSLQEAWTINLSFDNSTCDYKSFKMRSDRHFNNYLSSWENQRDSLYVHLYFRAVFYWSTSAISFKCIKVPLKSTIY